MVGRICFELKKIIVSIYESSYKGRSKFFFNLTALICHVHDLRDDKFLVVIKPYDRNILLTPIIYKDINIIKVIKIIYNKFNFNVTLLLCIILVNPIWVIFGKPLKTY